MHSEMGPVCQNPIKELYELLN